MKRITQDTLKDVLSTLNRVSAKQYALKGAYGKVWIEDETGDYLTPMGTKSEIAQHIFTLLKYREKEKLGKVT